MAKLIYLTLASLDGFIEDEDGKFDWAEPSEELAKSREVVKAERGYRLPE
jgi:hypothetical protein